MRTVSLPASESLAGDRRRVEAALERCTRRLLAGAPAAIAGPVRYALEGGGKRFRPLVCVGAYRAIAAAAPDDAVYDVAVAIELVHTYSLVHDDLPCMDDDDVRRGRPTVHRRFGSAAATVGGAALIPLAWQQVTAGCAALGLAADVTAAVSKALARGAGAGGLVGGQWLDLEAEGTLLNATDLERVHTRKTGALFAAAACIGGLLAGALGGTIAALHAYGDALGLAFQIADDLLDETGDPTVLGKAAGKDRARAKATYPGLLGLDGAEQRAERAVAAGEAALESAGIADDVLHALLRSAVDRER